MWNCEVVNKRLAFLISMVQLATIAFCPQWYMDLERRWADRGTFSTTLAVINTEYRGGLGFWLLMRFGGQVLIERPANDGLMEESPNLELMGGIYETNGRRLMEPNKLVRNLKATLERTTL
ncbi:hypothetical protein ACFX13_031675 [Malus domestica]